MSTCNLNSSVTFGLILFFTLTVIFGVYVTYAPSAFAYRCWDSANTPGKVMCCGESHGTTYCTECSNTNPPSHCSPRFPARTVGETAPPTDVAPPSTRTCPDGSAPDANDKCPPTTQAPTDQGTTLPPPDNHKGGNLGQLGGSLLNKDNNNNPSPSTSIGDNNNNDNSNKLSKHHKDS